MSYPRRPEVIMDLPAYMRAKNVERRASAKAKGICLECNDEEAQPGFLKCAGCRAVNQIRYQQRKAA